ncbi:rhomboid family intramembrane serine protease [Halobacteriales archaeon QS_4_69_34]|nr:MAG: rhomboid family intramembrane serine protease [Halobacteriales archaeon QS_4_69_34]
MGVLSGVPVWQLALITAVAASLLAVWRLDRPGGRWGATLRTRFVLGVPWGTLLTVGFVLSVYLFVQGGWNHWYRPVTIPFRSWSYLYPLGVVTAPFSHTGAGHLIGNLIGTLALGALAEFAWGHFPAERGSTSFSSLRTNPLARVLAVPAAAIAVGLFTSLFAIGPVIGFSGVVFAFAGFALVRYPLATVVALAAGEVLQLFYTALGNPITTARAAPGFGSPWWAEIAIQGHAIGLLGGALLGAALVRRRGVRPPALRLWLGVLVFAVGQSLWAVYWFRGGEQFVLYRALGAVLVLALAVLVAASVAASDRPVSARALRAWDGAAKRLQHTAGRLRTDADRPAGPLSAFVGGVAGLLRLGRGLRSPFAARRRVAAAVVLALALAALAGPAIPVNLTTVDGTGIDAALGGSAAANATNATDAPGVVNATGSTNATDATGVAPATVGATAGTVSVREYTVAYAENVTNRLVSAIDVAAFGETTRVNTSGVIVVNERRHLWTTAISADRLAFSGARSVRLGGVGWRASVWADRSGWTAGEETAYRVTLDSSDGPKRLAYTSEPIDTGATIDGRNVSIDPRGANFTIVAARANATLARVPVPAANETLTAAGITFGVRNESLFAATNDTRVRIAARETRR